MFLGIASQIDLAFYAILAIAVLFGFIRGLKKSIFNLIIMAIFYIVFFVTLNTMVDMLWSMNLSFLGSTFSELDSSLAGFQSFESDYQTLIQVLFNGSFDFSEPALDALAVGLLQFVIKIVWFIAYFTVILVLYKIITGIIRLIFVKNKENKHRVGGLFVGFANGVMAVFVSMIVLGGGISFLESASVFLEQSETPTQTVDFEPQRDNLLELNQSLIRQDQIVELADEDPLVSDDMLETINDLVTNYHENILVKLASSIKVTSSFNENASVPLHVDLFDQVLSFEYEDQPIALRQEVSVFVSAYDLIADDLDGADEDIFSISGSSIRSVFTVLEDSNILPAVMPVAIIYVANESELDLSLDEDGIYAIDYSTELGRIGNVVAGVFDLISGQDESLDDDQNTVTIDGAWVRDLFDDVANSELIILATETFLVPMIQEGDSTLSQIVEIEDGFEWDREFTALGDILGEMVDNGISISSVQDAEVETLLGVFSSITPSTLLSSDILSNGLIKILSKETDLEGLDVLSLPSNITWRSTDTTTGELEHILVAIQAIIEDQETLDLDNFDIDLINVLSQSTIDSILDSYIIRATITDQVASLELGDFNLLVPDDALDLQDYYTKDELQALLSSVKLLYDDLETFDIDTLFAMDSSEYDDLFESKIIRATITDQLASFNLGDDVLVIPNELYETADYLTIAALKNTLMSLKVVEADLDTFSLDALYDLEAEEYTQLFNSKIIRATITDVLSTFTLGSDALVIPSNIYETADYLSTASLTNLMLALNVVKGSEDTFTIDSMFSMTAQEYSDLFDSVIIRATITNMLTTYNLGTIALIIPDSLYETSDYLTKAELVALMTSISMFSASVDTFTLDALYDKSDAELNTIFNSEIMQATMSDIILDNAMSTQDPNQLSFIVPNVYRESIFVDSNAEDQILKTELVKIIRSFNTLGLNDYDGGISPSLMSAGLDYTIILDSGSMHATFDNVIDQNATLSVPDLAQADLYGFANVVIKAEIINLINAVDALGSGDDLTDVSFTLADIQALDATTRSTLLDSMIVRNEITPELEDAKALLLESFANTDYMNDDPLTFLKKSAVQVFLGDPVD